MPVIFRVSTDGTNGPVTKMSWLRRRRLCKKNSGRASRKVIPDPGLCFYFTLVLNLYVERGQLFLWGRSPVPFRLWRRPFAGRSRSSSSLAQLAGAAAGAVFAAVVGVAGVALSPYRARRGKNGVTSNGILSRARSEE